MTETPRQRLHHLIRAAAAEHDVSLDEVLSPSRRVPVVAARRQAVRQVKAARPEMTAPQLGRLFQRDHTTVLYLLGTLAKAQARGMVG